jgi:sugar transferase (PEP-CTERM/EpsH1 system associated)
MPLPALRAYGRTALSSWRPRPLTLSYFRSRRLHRRLRELAAERPLAAVVAFSTAMAPYALELDGPRVLDMVDVDSAKWAQYARRGALPMRPVYALEARRMRAYEVALAARFDRVVLATESERSLLLDLAPEAPAVTIRNGVDLDPEAGPVGGDAAPTLLFAGQMDYLPNVDAVAMLAREVLPLLRRRFPDLQLLVVGRCPTSTVRALATLPGVTVTGAVPEVRPFYARAWIFVAPLRIAPGVQTKVMEAMAAGLPVVTSSAVARGLRDGGVEPGDDMLVADGAAPFAAAVARLLERPAERSALAARGRARMREAFSWQRAGEELEAVIDEARAARAGAPRTASGERLARA